MVRLIAPPPFLSGRALALTPLAPPEDALLAGRPVFGDDEVSFAARDASGLAGVVVVAGIDWRSRSATLAWAGERRADEALALAARYALDELGLETVETEDDAAAATLGPLGFRPLPDGRMRLRRALLP